MFNTEQSSDVKGYLVLRDLFGCRCVPHIAIDFVHTESASGLFTYQGRETSLFLHRRASSGVDSALVGVLESLHNPWWQCIHLLRPLLFPNLCPFSFVFLHSSSTAVSDPPQIFHQAVAQSPAPALDLALPAAVAEETHLRNLVAFRSAAYHLGEERACHQVLGMEERRCSLASRRLVEGMEVERACRGHQLERPCIVSPM